MNLGLAILSLVLAVLLLEGAVRGHGLLQGRPFFGGQPFSVRDDNLGWWAARGVSLTRHLRDASGRRYEAHYAADWHGFQRAPARPGNRPRVLFLGDSFTQAVEVASDRAYPAVFAALNPEYAVYALGVGGYGTLQEYQLLGEAHPVARPTIVVWQFCSNDLINNLFDAERASYSHNNRRPRPYLNSGRIVVRDPTSLVFRILARLYEYSGLQLIKVIEVAIYKLSIAIHQADDIASRLLEPRQRAVLTRAMAVTVGVLQRARRDFSDTGFLGFNVCGDRRYGAIFEAIADRAGLSFLGNYEEPIQGRRTVDHEVLARDGRHLNEHGHHILGQLLSRDFRRAVSQHCAPGHERLPSCGPSR